jgi:hypothetical protein
MLVLYCYDYCLKFICWVHFFLTKLIFLVNQNISDCPSIWLSYTNWITRSGWCGIEGQRGTDGRRGSVAPTTSGRRSIDDRRGGSPPTRKWRRGRRTPTTDDLKLLPQDFHHANSTTSDNKFVLLPPCSIDVEFCSAILFLICYLILFL